MLPFPNRDASVHRDWPADVRYVAAEDGARIAEKGELGVALGNDRPLAFIRVQILVKTTVNDKRQKARIPATKLQWLPARHAILTSGSGRTLDGWESLRAGRDAQLLPCRPAVRYPGPNAHTGPDGRTSVNQPSAEYLIRRRCVLRVLNTCRRCRRYRGQSYRSADGGLPSFSGTKPCFR